MSSEGDRATTVTPGFRDRVVREFTVPTLVVAAISLVLSTLGALEMLADPYTHNPIVYFGMAAPAITGAWMSIELCWTKRTEPFFPRFGLRLYILGAIFILVNTVVHGVVTWEPARIAVERFPDQTDGFFSTWTQTFVLFDLLGMVAALGGGVAGLLLVTLPYFIFARTSEYADANMLEHDEKNLKAERVTGMAMVILLILVIAVPFFFVFGTQYYNPALVVIGWALIPLAVTALIIVWLTERPDRARRRAAGIHPGRFERRS